MFCKVDIKRYFYFLLCCSNRLYFYLQVWEVVMKGVGVIHVEVLFLAACLRCVNYEIPLSVFSILFEEMWYQFCLAQFYTFLYYVHCVVILNVFLNGVFVLVKIFIVTIITHEINKSKHLFFLVFYFSLFLSY